jgi:conjugal transfer/type IV secretion protein DotA/TraY
MLVTFFQAIIVFIFAIGILMVYYLPLIPLITWVGAVLGYIMFLFEAFIGSIFWAGAHAMQHAKQGYMLMLALVVRPNGGRIYWRTGNTLFQSSSWR